MNEYNNYWNSLSMRDKAEMIRVAIANGITTLPEIRQAYNKFAKGGALDNWTMQDEAGYRAWRSRLPKNLRDTNDNDYDMRGAYKAGMQPVWSNEDKSYHLGSRDPRTGRILKAPHHPTFLKALAEDARLGYYPATDRKGNAYTSTWKANEFADGGQKDSYIDADDRRHKVLLETRDGNLYDSNGNNYTQSYLDEDNVPVIAGTMPRDTRQYYDPSTTMEFVNAATAPISNFSPSNIVGSIGKAKDYSSFMSSFMNQDNNGFFTDNFAREHPIVTGVGNFIGDALAGSIFSQGMDLARKGQTAFKYSKYNYGNLARQYVKNGLLDDTTLDEMYKYYYIKDNKEKLRQLRDAHFLHKASNPLLNDDDTVKQLYHTVGDKYNPDFNIFDINIEGNPTAIYTTDGLPMSLSYTTREHKSKLLQDLNDFDNMVVRYKAEGERFPHYESQRKALEKKIKNSAENSVKQLYSNANNSITLEGLGRNWNHLPITENPNLRPFVHTDFNGKLSTRDYENAIRNNTTFDRLVVNNITDYGLGKDSSSPLVPYTVVENFNPSHLKYSDATVFDDLGELIPLSKRDNFLNPDMRYANGGTLFANGGYKPSARLQRDIATWEGSEMKRNAPFSEVTKQFNATIPAAIRAKLSQNQLDALYSYGYNVGMGNLKKRVLPTLNNFVQGKATNEDVQRSMWASKDNVLRGLTRRRNWEREMFGGNYRSKFTGTGMGTHIDPTLFHVSQGTMDNINSMINNVSIPQIQLPDTTAVDPSTVYKPPVIDDTLFASPKREEVPVYNPQQERMDNLKTFNTVMGLMGQSTPFAGLVGNNDTPSLLSYINQIYQ